MGDGRRTVGIKEQSVLPLSLEQPLTDDIPLPVILNIVNHPEIRHLQSIVPRHLGSIVR